LTSEGRFGVTEKYTKKVTNALHKAHAAIKIMLKKMESSFRRSRSCLNCCQIFGDLVKQWCRHPRETLSIIVNRWIIHV